MRIVIDIGHPADVHLFKHFIGKMEHKGNNILITASDKDVTLELLEKNNLESINLGSYGSSIISKMFNIPIMDIKMFNKVKDFEPDLFIGAGSIRAAHVSKLLRKPCINFDDTEHQSEHHLLYLPFTDHVLTPSSFRKDLGKKQIKYNGYQELAYLHPNWFNPNKEILHELGLSEKEKLILLRLVSWQASHDIGHYGIKNLDYFIEQLETHGRVLLSSERKIPSLKKYLVNLSPDKIHDLLHYCYLYVGEGATMVTESALLGTPAIYISTLSGKMGNLIELEEEFDLVYSFKNADRALEKAKELLANPNLKEEWLKKKEYLLSQKIDVTEFMVNFVDSLKFD